MKHLINVSLLFICTLNIFGQEIEFNFLNINSDKDDIAPAFYKDGLAFTSNRKNDLLHNYFEINKEGNEVYLNDLFYYSFSKDSTKFKKEHELDSLNLPYLHDGPCSFSKSYDTAYFARSSYQKNKRSKNKIGLYQSIFINQKWSTPSALNINSTEYNLSHPNISNDGKTLFYTSDKENGLGKLDIWYSIREQDGNWSVPINAGANINSTDDDVFPFLSKKNILYFASNRPKSMGGYDIFYTSWLYKTNLNTFESPINSAFDDYAFITNDNGKSGYITSNRRKDDNIYHFEHKIKLEDCEESFIPKFCFTFFDTELHRNEPHVKYMWDFGEDSVSHFKTPMHCFDTPGTKIIKLSMMDTITGVVSLNISEYTLEISRPLDFYFNEVLLNNQNNYTLHIKNHQLNNWIDTKIAWKVDEDYFVNQDNLSLHADFPSEYYIKAQVDYASNKCIKTIIPIDIDTDNYQQIKVIPDVTKGKVLSTFAEEKINSKLESNYHLTVELIISSENELIYKSWIEDLRTYLLNENGKTLKISIQEHQKDVIISFK